jgi:hypothetical protein
MICGSFSVMRLGEGGEDKNATMKKNGKKMSDPVDRDGARVIIGLLLLRVRPNVVLIFDN